MYATTFVVEGRGVFPYDMLRYDSCHPSAPQDIHNAFGVTGKRQVALVTYHKRKNDHYVTPGRWESFGWRVVKTNPANRYD